MGDPDERARAIARIYMMLDNRIRLFAQLRFDVLDRLARQRKLDEIGSARD